MNKVAAPFLTIAGRWRKHASAPSMQALPRDVQAQLMLCFYAGFAEGLNATAEAAQAPEKEAMHLLRELMLEADKVATMAVRYVGGRAQRGAASLAMCVLALGIAALLLLAGPLLDEASDAELQAAAVVDAAQQARHAADYERWARRVCGTATATSIQAEGEVVACYDARGQRVGTVAIAAKGLL